MNFEQQGCHRDGETWKNSRSSEKNKRFAVYIDADDSMLPIVAQT